MNSYREKVNQGGKSHKISVFVLIYTLAHFQSLFCDILDPVDMDMLFSIIKYSTQSDKTSTLLKPEIDIANPEKIETIACDDTNKSSSITKDVDAKKASTISITSNIKSSSMSDVKKAIEKTNEPSSTFDNSKDNKRSESTNSTENITESSTSSVFSTSRESSVLQIKNVSDKTNESSVTSAVTTSSISSKSKDEDGTNILDRIFGQKEQPEKAVTIIEINIREKDSSSLISEKIFTSISASDISESNALMKTVILSTTINYEDDSEKIIKELLESSKNQKTAVNNTDANNKENSEKEEAKNDLINGTVRNKDIKSTPDIVFGHDEIEESKKRFQNKKNLIPMSNQDSELLMGNRKSFWTTIPTDKGTEKILIKIKTITMVESVTRIKSSESVSSSSFIDDKTEGGILGLFKGNNQKSETTSSISIKENVETTSIKSEGRGIFGIFNNEEKKMTEPSTSFGVLGRLGIEQDNSLPSESISSQTVSSKSLEEASKSLSKDISELGISASKEISSKIISKSVQSQENMKSLSSNESESTKSISEKERERVESVSSKEDKISKIESLSVQSFIESLSKIDKKTSNSSKSESKSKTRDEMQKDLSLAIKEESTNLAQFQNSLSKDKITSVKSDMKSIDSIKNSIEKIQSEGKDNEGNPFGFIGKSIDKKNIEKSSFGTQIESMSKSILNSFGTSSTPEAASKIVQEKIESISKANLENLKSISKSEEKMEKSISKFNEEKSKSIKEISESISRNNEASINSFSKEIDIRSKSLSTSILDQFKGATSNITEEVRSKTNSEVISIQSDPDKTTDDMKSLSKANEAKSMSISSLQESISKSISKAENLVQKSLSKSSISVSQFINEISQSLNKENSKSYETASKSMFEITKSLSQDLLNSSDSNGKSIKIVAESVSKLMSEINDKDVKNVSKSINEIIKSESKIADSNNKSMSISINEQKEKATQSLENLMTISKSINSDELKISDDDKSGFFKKILGSISDKDKSDKNKNLDIKSNSTNKKDYSIAPVINSEKSALPLIYNTECSSTTNNSDKKLDSSMTTTSRVTNSLYDISTKGIIQSFLFGTIKSLSDQNLSPNSFTISLSSNNLPSVEKSSITDELKTTEIDKKGTIGELIKVFKNIPSQYENENDEMKKLTETLKMNKTSDLFVSGDFTTNDREETENKIGKKKFRFYGFVSPNIEV